MKHTATNLLASPRRLLRLPEVVMRCGVGRTTLYEMIAREEFPAPVKIGARSSAWPLHEVERWIEDRIEARKGKPKA